MRSLALFALLTTMAFVFTNCGSEDATCSDGIKNQDETAVDCGGPCPACATCDDGIKNGDETGVDCGGSCNTCGTCTDGIQNGDETGVDCGGSCDPCAPAFSEHITCKINDKDFEAQLVLGSEDDLGLAFQSDQSQDRQLAFLLPKATEAGTYDLTAKGEYAVRYSKILDGEYTTEKGSITISKNNKADAELSGTFNFTAIKYEFGEAKDSVVVTDGSFDVEY